MNGLLEENFPSDKLSLISADRAKIIYCLYKFKIIFDFAPDQYEDDSYMFLKGILMKEIEISGKNYSVIQVVSFLKNNCEFVGEYPKVLTLDEHMELLKEFLILVNKNTNVDWEIKYGEYKMKKTNNRR